MADVLLQEKKGEGILLLTLNRPEAMNCFSLELLGALGDAIREANFDNTLRCLIITGAGGDDPKKASFSTGADLKERRTMSPDQVRRFIFTIRNVFTSVEQLRVPVLYRQAGLEAGGAVVAGIDDGLSSAVGQAQGRVAVGGGARGDIDVVSRPVGGNGADPIVSSPAVSSNPLSFNLISLHCNLLAVRGYEI